MEAKDQKKNDFTKKRQQYTIGIRKHRIEELISKRRNQGDELRGEQADDNSSKINYLVDQRYAEHINKFQKSRFHVQNLPDLFISINSTEILQQHWGVIGVRKIMSLTEDPPIQVIIDMGMVPRLIELVKQDEYPQLQLQATWSLANVASGNQEQCVTIINKDAIPMFIKLLKSNHAGIVEQAIWALGNIASDSTFNRDAVIRHGGITNLIYAITHANSSDLIQPGAWALSNLCRGTPAPNYQIIKQGVLFIGQLLRRNNLKQNSIFSDCCWSISYNFPKKQQQYTKLISRELIFKLKQKLKTQDFAIIVPIIRIFGHITKINNFYVDLVLENQDIVDIFYNLLSFSKKVVRIQTCWIISNIASAPQKYINKLLQHQGLILKLFELFQSDSEEIKRQICYLFSNMTSEGDPELVFKFFRQFNILKFYVLALSSQDSKLIQNSLETMYPILELGQKFKKNGQNLFVLDLGNMGALGTLEELQLHDEQFIYESVVKIMKQFFQMDDSVI